MATPYKPDEAVILFVTHKGAIHQCCLLSNTHWGIGSSWELEFRQELLTNRKIPWDNYGEYTGEDLTVWGDEQGTALRSTADIGVDTWMTPLRDGPARDVFLDIQDSLRALLAKLDQQ